LDAVETTFAAEERATSLLARYVRPISEVLGLIPKLKPAAEVAKAAAGFIWCQSRDRDEALHLVLTEEMKRVNARLAEFGKPDQNRAEFDRQFPDFVLDGLGKAEQTRAEERIQRLGLILGHAYELGRGESFDLAEELMRVAMSLNEQDVRVLSWLGNGLQQHFSDETGQVDDWNTNKFWGQIDDHGYTRSNGMPPIPAGMIIGDVMACCAKLQGFGLVIQVRQNSSNVRMLPYSPLKRGYQFLEYIKGASAS
jgi:hypothetical protein